MIKLGMLHFFISRFIVNLQQGTGTDANVALHFNPRYDTQPPMVVLNSRQNGDYGQENKYYSSPLPVDSAFSLLLTVLQESYQVSSTQLGKWKEGSTYLV